MPPFTQPVAAVFGGTRIGNRDQFMPHTHLETFLQTLTRHHVTKIDTAQVSQTNYIRPMKYVPPAEPRN
ncbi:hypothetical protein M441DRAFT_63061 [Trichoderma asperellum CBS 433.97]|uniref:Uncharacterized protein n=1 Tax=Trichoderma asperellum (strain ATCC 204424 / CBS 433.97 / NBRC 101777) TaxID=1042311 RepID=A0A2T3YR05_TRIA4|nr:hypothetical protein M441DRAFT_63061 [Trichoderma asperellum CBS 433.97]PTB34998.1 hypothetical protein M441DRAFT_63061 [Trichoderma asperellum CBS 433.97]